MKGTEGAAHLKNRDTTPPTFWGYRVYVVNAALTLLTTVFIILMDFSLTFVNAPVHDVNAC